MTSKGSKLVAILLIAVVVAAGAGYWLLTPKIPNETTSIAPQTSVLTPLERSRTSTEWTVLGSPTTGPWATTQTLWLNVSASYPVSYYLGLLESNGTEPYVQLAKELRKLPDFTNATAVSKIVDLALNATNPEVKEAFELMIKGGTPYSGDFSYVVPNYNTELQVLYWLALQNDFKKDDTLALAVAISNGLWVTIGNDQVRDQVRNDTNAILTFFRTTNEMQMQSGYFQLENYPLDAKIELAWTGNRSPAGFGEPEFTNSQHALFRHSQQKVDLHVYNWDSISPATLAGMQLFAQEKRWVTGDVDRTASNIEYYFFFNEDLGSSSHWYRVNPGWSNERYITIDGESVKNRGMQNVNFEFQYFLKTGNGIGHSLDEAAFMEGWLKSVGIASVGLWPNGEKGAHGLTGYFEPKSRTWKVDEQQVQLLEHFKDDLWTGNRDYFLDVYKPPTDQIGYLKVGTLPQSPNHDLWDGGMVHVVQKQTLQDYLSFLRLGISDAQMKQWLLYS